VSLKGDITMSVSVMGTQEKSNDRRINIDESSMQSTSSIFRICIMKLAASSSLEDDDEEFDTNVRQVYEEIDGYRPKRLDVEEDLLKSGNPKNISILDYTNWLASFMAFPLRK